MTLFCQRYCEKHFQIPLTGPSGCQLEYQVQKSAIKLPGPLIGPDAVLKDEESEKDIFFLNLVQLDESNRVKEIE